MTNGYTAQPATPKGTAYATRPKPFGRTSVMVGDFAASKTVEPVGSGLWRSEDGQTFASLDAVADTMGWAV